jgi:hypothetical protein
LISASPLSLFLSLSLSLSLAQTVLLSYHTLIPNLNTNPNLTLTLKKGTYKGNSGRKLIEKEEKNEKTGKTVHSETETVKKENGYAKVKEKDRDKGMDGIKVVRDENTDINELERILDRYN